MKSLNNLLLFDEQGNLDGFLLAIDATRNTAGQVVCRVNADADPTNDRPDCVPINVFGSGSPSAEALTFVNTTSPRAAKAAEFVELASAAGHLSQLSELPGAPIASVPPPLYRTTSAYSALDPLTDSC